MTRVILCGVVLLLVSAGTATQVEALVIDFESAPASSAGVQHGSSLTTQGFTISQTQGSNRLFGLDGTNPQVHSNGTNTLYDDTTGVGSDYTIVESTGALFDFHSFDASEAFADPNKLNENAQAVGVVGFDASGPIVQAQFSLDGVVDGPGGNPDFQTFTLPANFVNLTSVRIAWISGPLPSTYDLFAIDNLSVTVIPEPISLSLLAVAGLAFLGRRRSG
jgi:hypothetical protein